MIKKHLALALLVLSIYTLCACGSEIFQSSQASINTQPVYEEITKTPDKLRPITIAGKEYYGNETEIDMTGMSDKSYDTALEFLQKLPCLNTLITADTPLTCEQYLSLCDINKDVSIVSKINFEGKDVDMTADEIDISGHTVKDKAAFAEILSKIKKKIKFVMCDCGYTNEEMQGLRDSYPSLEFAWRIYMGKWNLRTDDEAFSVMIYNYDYVKMTSEDIQVLQYCTNLYSLDLGHQEITDLSVLYKLPELRVLILADNKVSDITPIGSLQKLEYIELFVNRVSDISPLANCKNLVDVNIGWNRGMSDISSLYTLEKVERLWIPTTSIPTSEHAKIKKEFSGAQIVFADVDSVSSGWRTHPRYFVMRGMYTNNKYDPNFVNYK